FGAAFLAAFFFAGFFVAFAFFGAFLPVFLAAFFCAFFFFFAAIGQTSSLMIRSGLLEDGRDDDATTVPVILRGPASTSSFGRIWGARSSHACRTSLSSRWVGRTLAIAWCITARTSGIVCSSCASNDAIASRLSPSWEPHRLHGRIG